jgi:hypothetical protein
MDTLDRMLSALPEDEPSAELSARIRLLVHRRHRRRQVARWSGASLLGLAGAWLVWPAILWLSSSTLYASGTPWLMGSLDYLNHESLDMLNGFWNGAVSAQDAIGTALGLSTWLGALLLCCAIFLVIDSRAWQPASRPRSHGGTSTMLATSVHI